MIVNALFRRDKKKKNSEGKTKIKRDRQDTYQRKYRQEQDAYEQKEERQYHI